MNRGTPIVRPSTQTIYNLGKTIIRRLFNRKYNGNLIRYNTEDIVTLFNYVSNNSNHIPDDINIPWGDAIMTLSSAQSTLHKLGIRGQAIQQHNKQAILSSLIVKDNNNDIKNMKLLRNLAPHKSINGKKEFIRKCKQIRDEFDCNFSNVLSQHLKHKRNS